MQTSQVFPSPKPEPTSADSGGMALPGLFLFALSMATLTTESPLRSGCGEDEPQVGVLPAGIRVEVRSAMSGGSGTCYKVAAEVEGKQITGYVPAKALANLESFEQARRSARDLSITAAVNDVTAISKNSAAGNNHAAGKIGELISTNQPAEALMVAERELVKQPQDPVLLAMAGIASYRLDQLDNAIRYWRKSLAIHPNASIDRLYRKAEQEKAADSGSERMVGNRVILRYERNIPESLARAMLAVLDEEYARVSAHLGCRASEKVAAIVQSREAYMRATDAAEWSGGQYDGRIHIPLTQTQTISQQTRETFAHELVHACLSELGRWPAWIQEGLAQRYSGEQLAPSRRAQVMNMIASNQIPKLSKLSQTFARMSAQHAGIAYAVALVAAEKLTELTANTGIANALRNPSEIDRLTAEVERALGI